MTPRLFQPARRRDAGFSLIELLVVISIATLLIGVSFPFLRQMVRSSSETLAADNLSNAVAAARAFSTRYKPFTDQLPNGKSAEDDGDGYSGAAVIVTPANELRIVENFERATDSSNNRLELPSGTQFIRNGYAHIEGVDDLRVPGRAVVLGIRRRGNNEVELLPPPFAISFNRRGGMVVRDAASGGLTATNKRSDGFVYYDGDGDGRFEINRGRDNPDHPTIANPVLSDFSRGTAPRIDNNAADRLSFAPPNMEGRRVIPYERLEPVIGVVIFVPDNVPSNVVADNANSTLSLSGPYDPDRFEPYVINTDSPDKNLLEWASQPGAGIVIFFNRNTGADMNR
ncbi:MAG: prepilin-type N-terminal cleavage/methylation domain-containing protein [Planctomycetota bacterium]